MAKENKIVTYASPLNVRNVTELSKRAEISKSKIINEALTVYFTIKNREISKNNHTY